MKTKDLQKAIAAKMKDWQKTENRAVSITGQMIDKTENPMLRLVMEIIQRDSQMHHRIQQFLIDGIESRAYSLSTDELNLISSMVGKHKKVEDEMLCAVESLLSELKGKKMMVEEYFLNFLVADETKHCKMLAALDTFKKGLYPYA